MESSTLTVDSTHGLKAGDKFIIGPKKHWFKRFLRWLMFWKPKSVWVITSVESETSITFEPSENMLDLKNSHGFLLKPASEEQISRGSTTDNWTEGLVVSKLCCKCKKLFILRSVGVSHSNEIETCYEDCPHCGERNTTWLNIKKVGNERLSPTFNAKSVVDPENPDPAMDKWIEKLGEVRNKYDELIMAVETKHKNETRHQTALRYIQGAERRTSYQTGKDKST